jgi:hypothetical protein
VRSGADEDAGVELEPVEPDELEPDDDEPHEPDERESAGDGALRGRAVRPVLLAPTPGW